MDKVPFFLRSKWESTHGITMKTEEREKNHNNNNNNNNKLKKKL
jgi:hypothetical protein